MNKVLFPNIAWWLFLLVPITLAGFYATYFSRSFGSMPVVFHVHAFAMIAWVVMAILQPFLIHTKKTRLHRRIGKCSYMIMPLVIITGWWMISESYHSRVARDLLQAEKSPSTVNTAAIIETVQEELIIGVVYITWLAIFYLLAIAHRKKKLFHATYMFAAILTLLGPTLDRVLFQVYRYFGIGYNLFAEMAVFCLIDVLLLALVWHQWRNGLSPRASATALIIYFVGQLAYFFLPATSAWKKFVELVM